MNEWGRATAFVAAVLSIGAVISAHCLRNELNDAKQRLAAVEVYRFGGEPIVPGMIFQLPVRDTILEVVTVGEWVQSPAGRYFEVIAVDQNSKCLCLMARPFNDEPKPHGNSSHGTVVHTFDWNAAVIDPKDGAPATQASASDLRRFQGKEES